MRMIPRMRIVSAAMSAGEMISVFSLVSFVEDLGVGWFSCVFFSFFCSGLCVLLWVLLVLVMSGRSFLGAGRVLGFSSVIGRFTLVDVFSGGLREGKLFFRLGAFAYWALEDVSDTGAGVIVAPAVWVFRALCWGVRLS